MILNQLDANILKALPCFSTIVAFELLADGMSHTCVKVTTTEQVFLAKKLNFTTARTETFAALTCAKQDLSPRVIYHDEQWLVTEFISGTTLAKAELKRSEQISIAVTLMKKLHQLPILKNNRSIPTLNTTKSIESLIPNSALSNAYKRLTLVKLTKLLTNEINVQIASLKASNVICHGDINFSNILIGSINDAYGSSANLARKKAPWLIDFECAHLAPVEYDLAMFIAVNNIPFNNIEEVVENYMTLAPSFQVHERLLAYYILYSYFINGLWYLDNINNLEVHNPALSLAIEQWSTFDEFAIKQSLNLPKLIALIN